MGDVSVFENMIAPTLGDLDGDGDFDMITGSNGGGLYRYENTGGTSLQPEMTLVESGFLGIGLGWSSYPVLVDIDSDGDLDIYVTGHDGIVAAYENVGSATTPDFELADSAVIDYGSTTAGFAMHDIDMDGLIDIVIAKNFDVYLVPNVGTAGDPEFSIIDSSYFIGTSFATVGLGIGDLDGDSLPEFIIGGEHCGIELLKNTGTAIDPTWDRISPWQTIDATYLIAVRAVDINGDGLLDIYSSGYHEIIALENVGAVGAPEWELNTDFTEGLGSNWSWRPDFADLDNDGDYDVVCGSWDTHLHYFENIGSASNPVWATVVDDWMGIEHEVEYLSPNLVDIDDDGDLDLFVGDESRQMYYYENVGSATSPDFTDSIVIGDFPGAGTSMNLYRPGMTFLDWDDDGDYDIIGGADYFDSKLAYWENTGSESTPEWLTMASNVMDTSSGYLTSVTPMDYNNDGHLDMLCGTFYGGMFLYLNEAIPVVEENSVRPRNIALSTYPNPFNSAITISLDFGSESAKPLSTIEIFDVNGRRLSVISMRALPEEKSPAYPQEISRQARNDNVSEFVWRPAPSLGSGVYLVRVTVGTNVVSKRIVYLK